MKRPLLFGAFSLFFAQLVFLLSGYGINIFLARAFGPADYGLYSIVISLITLLSLVLISGTHSAVSKFVSQHKEKAESIKRAALKLNSVIAAIAFFAYFFAADLIASLLNDSSLTPFIRFSSIIIPGYFLYPVFLGYFNGLKKYKMQSLITIVYSLAKFFLIISFVLIGFSVFGAIGGFALASIAALLFGLFFSSFNKASEHFSCKRLLYLAVPITFFAFALEFSLSLGLLAVKSLLGGNDLAGYYNAALQISRLPYYFSVSLGAAFFPLASSSFSEKNKTEFRYHFKKTLKYFAIFAVPCALLVSLFSKPIVEMLFGAEFVSSAQVLSILGIASIFVCLFYILCIALIAIEKQKQAMFISLAVLVIAFILNAFLVPILSLEGAAIATLIAFIIGSVISSIAVWRFIYH